MKKLVMAFIAVVTAWMFGCANITAMAQTSSDPATAQDSVTTDTTTPPAEDFFESSQIHDSSLLIKDTSTERVEIKHYYQQCEISQAKLFQSYPAPCLADTLYIGYSVPEHKGVRLEMYNVLGELVDVLVDENQHEGRYELRLRFFEDTISPGIYFYRIAIGGYTNTKKLIILR